ncbi:hypothetical protein L873DRAFT_889533 [Choiromyces venosus 120613-1]|uniref:Uncharacterized protein n=1 Tax=Choiromyces venosus 120613-1 TaxID=1336337 RepID=A0A3N4K0U3_9PEZI|nr:hypothetical protein L873DRAFT_889533 [Choiromyces venosus 120613-1]
MYRTTASTHPFATPLPPKSHNPNARKIYSTVPYPQHIIIKNPFNLAQTIDTILELLPQMPRITQPVQLPLFMIIPPSKPAKASSRTINFFPFLAVIETDFVGVWISTDTGDTIQLYPLFGSPRFHLSFFIFHSRACGRAGKRHDDDADDEGMRGGGDVNITCLLVQPCALCRTNSTCTGIITRATICE